MRESWDLETTVLLISLAIIPVLVAILALCLKIKASKSNPDLFGVEGTVKRTRPEDGFSPAGTADPRQTWTSLVMPGHIGDQRPLRTLE